MLEKTVKDELFTHTSGNEVECDTIEYGILPETLRLEQFKTTLESVVLPGFENFGIEITAAKAWLDNKLCA